MRSFFYSVIYFVRVEVVRLFCRLMFDKCRGFESMSGCVFSFCFIAEERSCFLVLVFGRVFMFVWFIIVIFVFWFILVLVVEGSRVFFRCVWLGCAFYVCVFRVCFSSVYFVLLEFDVLDFVGMVSFMRVVEVGF